MWVDSQLVGPRASLRAAEEIIRVPHMHRD